MAKLHKDVEPKIVRGKKKPDRAHALLRAKLENTAKQQSFSKSKHSGREAQHVDEGWGSHTQLTTRKQGAE
jgi:hypothetical protein